MANTAALAWGGKLLALWEGGLPHQIDPLSLSTIGASEVGGVLEPPGSTFAAHPRLDPANDRVVNFSYKPNPVTGTKVTFWEFNSDFRLHQEAVECVARPYTAATAAAPRSAFSHLNSLLSPQVQG